MSKPKPKKKTSAPAKAKPSATTVANPKKTSALSFPGKTW
jgi:hypothetical protein